MANIIRIATRQSPLALWQANAVKDRLEALHQNLEVTLVPMTTKGDQLLDSPLARIGGKGLFIKELEVAMLEDRADIAVHSMKDVPAAMPDGFSLGPILSRESPYDAFVSNRFAHLNDLPNDAVVGTCSLRRGSQILKHKPSVTIHNLRGNVNTRLAKLDAGEFDAIILAESGLERLGFGDRVRHAIDRTISLPAVGQGAIGIELRANDTAVAEWVQPLACEITTMAVLTERAMNRTLNGGCQAPIAGYATIDQQQITLTGRVLTPDGKTLLEESGQSALNPTDAVTLGHTIGQQLLDKGADAILSELGIQTGNA